MPPGRLARVAAQHRSGYRVSVGDGEFAVQPPAAWLRRRIDPELRAAVGDWVWLAADEDVIHACLPRHSLLRRGAAGEHYGRQLIAANIDTVLVVAGLDGDFNPRRLERYLLLTRDSGAATVIVLTKADLCPDLPARLAALDGLRAQGVPIVTINARETASAAALSAWTGPGQSLVLVGSSGTGKSTLTNCLLGIERQKTADVRQTDSRGRHTTTHRSLIALPGGGCLIDTPGMRELKPTGDEDLAEGGFEDVEALAADCRFRDCAHQAEPGCAVRKALQRGELDGARLANYLKLRGELAQAGAVIVQRARRAAQPAGRRPERREIEPDSQEH
ncbi:MAG: ribosome small subunit-dependent GTPase A [Lysobacteraceae bacterium]